MVQVSSYFLSSIVFVSEQPLQLLVLNTRIVDYYLNNAGFILEITCNYTGAAVFGEIMFNNISFGQESEETDKIAINNFIHYTGPMNFTLQNSHLNIHNNEFENIDMYIFEDNARWAPSADYHQNVRIIFNLDLDLFQRKFTYLWLFRWKNLQQYQIQLPWHFTSPLQHPHWRKFFHKHELCYKAFYWCKVLQYWRYLHQ